ncbi:hypothetical protein PFFVO_01094 [Plasmodium falciparum Vietnam Oak-Knoll (FVO)]|nr:hypothetical protein PFFVO_01094 [Plasmodium falciparum Vietnam Oak-Knoll (FVO)]
MYNGNAGFNYISNVHSLHILSMYINLFSIFHKHILTIIIRKNTFSSFVLNIVDIMHSFYVLENIYID